MKKAIKKLIAAAVAVTLGIVPVSVMAACASDGGEPGGGIVQPSDPVKVADGISIAATDGEVKYITVADYITANGNTVTANSSNEGVATVAVSEGLLTITAVGAGETTVTLSCVGVSVSFAVTVASAAEVAPSLKAAEVISTDRYDVYDGSYTVDLAANINNADKIAGYSVDGTEVDGTTYNIVVDEADYGDYSLTPVNKTITVVATMADGKGSLTYTFTVPIISTAVYRVENGGFEKGNLDGWTPSWENESDAFGAVTNDFGYWNNGNHASGGNAYEKDGNYLFSWWTWDDDASGEVNREDKVGTLSSSAFTLKANATVSFKLGGAGGGIRFIDGNGKILAQFVNTKFAGREGKLNQFYYVFDNAEDIADCKAVIYDYNVSGSWNVVSADSIVTYYKSVNDVPKGATLAVNTYADKTAINAAIESAEALGVLEQGDYTIESYDDFVDALTDAKNLCNDDFATVERVNAATAALTAAQSALALREPSVKTGAEKNLVIEPSGSKEITVSDYFDENGLSSITYDITTQSDKIALSEISEGKFTITAGSDTAEGVTVTMVIKYKDAEKASVTLNITVTNAVLAPEITHENVDHAETVDLFAINSTPKSVVLDLTANVIRNGNTTLKYTVQAAGGAESAEIATPDEYSFEIPEGEYGLTATPVAITVKIAYEATAGSGTLTYTYTLNVVDTTAYRAVNGGFETGDTSGWTVAPNDYGTVSAAAEYWDGLSHQQEGTRFFWGDENKSGTLTSSTFTVGGSGWITYRMGAASHYNEQYVEIVDASDNAVLKRFINQNFTDAGGYDGDANKVSGMTLNMYKADLSAYIGRSVYVRVTDNRVGGGIGMMLFDDLATYYATAEDVPAGFVEATDCLYSVYNGGFELGNIGGWKATGNLVETVVDFDTYFEGISHQKEGKYFLWGKEGKTEAGTLTSTTFRVGGSGWITYRIGSAKHFEAQYVEIVGASDNVVLKKFINQDFIDAGAFDGDANKNSGMTLNKYKVDLSEFMGRDVYVRIVDNWLGGDYGRVLFDDLATYYATADDVPADFAEPANYLYNVVNGGFEFGNINGWTATGNMVDNVVDFNTYFEGILHQKEGKYFLWGKEGKTEAGTLTSTVFRVGGSGWITYRMGAASHPEAQYVEIVRASDNVVLKKFDNQDFIDAGGFDGDENKVSGMTLNKYKVNLSEFMGQDIYVRIVDNWLEGGFGMVLFDDLVTYYVTAEEVPEGFTEPTDRLTQADNE